MNPPIKNIIKAFLFLIICCYSYSAHAQGDAIIAVVNDDVITMKDLRQYIADAVNQLKIENKSPQDIQKMMEEYEQKGLDRLIEDKLILAQANTDGMDIHDDAVDQRLKEIKDRYPSEDDFVKALDAEGLTIGDLRQKLTDQLKIKYEVDAQVREKIIVNPDDVTNYYNQHQAEFSRKASVNLQSVFISFSKYDKQTARNRADEARSRLMAGEDFDKVSQEYSDGASIGEVERGQMTEAIENVVFNLGLNQISDPLEVEDGIYVFKVIGISTPQQESLAQVNDQIYVKLQEEQFQSKFREWVDGLRKKAYVEIKQ